MTFLLTEARGDGDFGPEEPQDNSARLDPLLASVMTLTGAQSVALHRLVAGQASALAQAGDLSSQSHLARVARQMVGEHGAASRANGLLLLDSLADTGRGEVVPLPAKKAASCRVWMIRDREALAEQAGETDWIGGDVVLLMACDRPEAEMRRLEPALNALYWAACALVCSHARELRLTEALAQERRSSEFCNQFNELAGVGGWEIDGETREVFWTGQTYRIHDLPEGSPLELEVWFEYCHPDYQPLLEMAFREALRNGSGWDLKLRICTATGRDIWVHSICQPIFVPGRTKPRLVGSVIDISSRMAIEVEVNNAQQLYRSTLDSLEEGILVADRDGILRWYNSAAETILQVETLYQGMSHLEDIGEAFAPDGLDLEGEDTSWLRGEDLRRRLLNDPTSLRWSAYSRVGEKDDRKYLKCHSEPLLNEGSGELVGVVISINDVTLQKNTEDMLNEVFEAIPSGFAIYDKEDTLLMANGAYRADIFAGARKNACLGRRYDDLMRKALARGQFPDAPASSGGREDWLAERKSGFLMPQSPHVEQLEGGRWIQTSSEITPSSYRADFFTDVTEIKRQASILRAVFDRFPGAVALLNEAMDVTDCNVAWLKLMHMEPGAAENGLKFADALHQAFSVMGSGAEDLDAEVRKSFVSMRSGDGKPYERQFADGTVYRISAALLPEGSVLNFVEDVTERRRAAEDLAEKARLAREKSEELEVTLAHLDMGVSVFDRLGRLQTWNQKYIELFNKGEGEVLRGATLRDLMMAEKERGDFDGDVDAHVEALFAALRRGEVVRSRFHLSIGRVLSSIHSPLPDGGWIGTHSILMASDMGDQEALKARKINPATGLHDQEWLVETLEDLLTQFTQTNRYGLLMVVDPVSSACALCSEALEKRLCRITDILRDSVRGNDQIAHLSGGKIAVLFVNVQDNLEIIHRLAERTRESLEAVCACSAGSDRTGLALGGVRLDRQTGSANDALDRAFAALERARLEPSGIAMDISTGK